MMNKIINRKRFKVNYIKLYMEMIPKLSIMELLRQKESFEQDINLPDFNKTKEYIILSLLNERISKLSVINFNHNENS